jgi:hypothetical protein
MKAKKSVSAKKANHSDDHYLASLMRRTERTSSGCMEFTGCVQSNGYSRATVRGKTDYGHRHVFRLAFGEIADKLDVCHKCDNRKCINPEHLFLGTRKQNMEDAMSKGRTARGFSLPHAKLSEFDREAIVNLAEQGVLYKEIAAQFGIHRVCANKIALQKGITRNGLSK